MEIQALREEVNTLRGLLNNHLITCAAGNARLDLKMRLMLIGLAAIVFLIAPENPIVLAVLKAVGAIR